MEQQIQGGIEAQRERDGERRDAGQHDGPAQAQRVGQAGQRDNQGGDAHIADDFLIRQPPERGEQRFEDVRPIYGERGGLMDRQTVLPGGRVPSAPG